MSLRRLLPASGRPYELFDSAVMLWALSFVGLVKGTSMSAEHAFAHVGYYLSIQAFGVLVTVAATVAIVLSYVPSRVDVGYLVAAFTTGFTSALYVGSLFVVGFDDRVLVSALIYGYITRRLITEDAKA